VTRPRPAIGTISNLVKLLERHADGWPFSQSGAFSLSRGYFVGAWFEASLNASRIVCRGLQQRAYEARRILQKALSPWSFRPLSAIHERRLRQVLCLQRRYLCRKRLVVDEQ